MKFPLSWKKKRLGKEYLSELLLFFFSIAAAYFIGWNNTDLLWSFWITSLVVGYVSVFRTILSHIRLILKSKSFNTDKVRDLTTVKKLQTVILVAIFIVPILLWVVFINLHFFIFHLLLAYLLQVVFPHPVLTNILADPKGGQFYTTFQIIKALFMSYWIIIFEKFIFDYKTNRKLSSNQTTHLQPFWVNEAFSFEGIKRPYVQVVRIHISIFLLFAMDAVETNQYLIYVVIYSLFFFPNPILRKVKSLNMYPKFSHKKI